jgi:hypothetical protein
MATGAAGEARDSAPDSAAEPRRYGRAVFLATVAGGLSSLAWGKPVWSHLSRAISPAESLVPLLPTGGWRIYTVSGSMPTFDRRTWRLEVGGLVEHKLSLSYEDLRALPRVRSAMDGLIALFEAERPALEGRLPARAKPRAA